MSHLFLSYNSRDRDKVRSVHRYLNGRGVDTFFDQQNLRAGTNWAQALEHALRGSRAVAVFVGPQIGNWQWPEIGFALDRQASEQSSLPVIPILLDGADTSRSFLFLNTWVDLRGDRLEDASVLAQLLAAVSDTTADKPEQHVAINPYRGLEFFGEEHAPFFFGREAFINDLFDRLTGQRKKFVAVIGASGSGKSSVVRAGLIPKLRRRRPPNETWDVAVFTPGERPWVRLATALAPLRFPDKSDTELDIEVDKLADALGSGSLQLTSVLDRILQPQGKLHRLLLVADQFEELFTLTKSDDRSAFIDQLMASLQVEGVVLVPTLRADFYGQAIEAHRKLSDMLGAEQVTLGRLTQEELRLAIFEPARLAHLEFDPGLPELVLRDAGNEPGNLPLLQHALLELYEKGKSAGRMTSKAYEEIGGIRRAIANSAEREYQRLEQLGQGQLVRQVFTQLVRLARADEGLEDTRRRIAIDTLPAGGRTIVDEFANYDRRLLVKASERVDSEGRSAERQGHIGEQQTVEVAHEALIREWDRLKGWLNEDRGFYLWRQRLDQALDDYDRTGDLLTGAALKEAEGKLSAPMPDALADNQRKFIEASIEARDKAQRAEREREEERRREKERLLQLEHAALAQTAETERDRRRAADRVKRISIGTGVVLLAIASFAIWKFLDAEQQRETVVAQTLVVRAKGFSAEQRVNAALLTALALQIRPTQGAKDVAIALLSGAPFTTRQPLRGHEGDVSSVAFSPDGMRIVSGGADNTLRLWDAKSGASIGKPLHGHEGEVFSVAFSPDGTRIVSGGADNTLRLWDAKSGASIGEPVSGPEVEMVIDVAFSPDGRRLVGRLADGTPRLWDAKGGAPTDAPMGAPLRDQEGEIAFSADGTRVASASEDHTIRLWDVKTGAPIGEPMRGHESNVYTLAFSPDGTRLASGSDDNTLRLWDAKSGASIGEPLRGHEAGVMRAVFSPDGTVLVSASYDGTLRLWDVKKGAQIGVPLQGHTEVISSLAFSPDGTRFVSGSGDALRLWAKNSAPVGEPLRGHQDGIMSVAFSPDGTRLVSGSEDDTLRLWDAKSGVSIGEPLRGHDGDVWSVAFSPDGTRLVSGSDDSTLRLWDSKSGGPLGKPLHGHASVVTSVMFSPDGAHLVSGSGDRTLRLWDSKSGASIGEPLHGHEDEVLGLAFSPDGTRLVSAGADDTLRLWDAESATPIGAPLRGHDDAVIRVAFSPDGERFASASLDKTLRLWDAKSGAPIGEPLRGHEDRVLSVAFGPDGTRLASGSADLTLRLWDAKSGAPIGEPLRGHQADVFSVAFSPDGTRLASGSLDGTIRLWDPQVLESDERLSEMLCQTVDRNLTCAEWRLDVPEGEKYRAVCDHVPLEPCSGERPGNAEAK